MLASQDLSLFRMTLASQVLSIRVILSRTWMEMLIPGIVGGTYARDCDPNADLGAAWVNRSERTTSTTSHMPMRDTSRLCFLNMGMEAVLWVPTLSLLDQECSTSN